VTCNRQGPPVGRHGPGLRRPHKDGADEENMTGGYTMEGLWRCSQFEMLKPSAKHCSKSGLVRGASMTHAKGQARERGLVPETAI
jgi:hypothetical protein